MNQNENIAEENAETTEENATPAGNAEEKVETPPTADDRLHELEEKLAAAEKSLAEKDDKYLRLAAEYDNFRRRTAQERNGIYADAVSDAVKELLPVLDDLERAALYTDAEKVSEGLAIIAKSAAAAMQKLGVTAFGESGENFDPALHNAVMHAEDENLGENVITDVFQKGYKKGDKIIRHAMVKVAN